MKPDLLVPNSQTIDLHTLDKRLLLLALIITAILVAYFASEYIAQWRRRHAFRQSWKHKPPRLDRDL